MNIPGRKPRSWCRQKGSALLIVIILLAAMVTFVLSNTRAIVQFKQELNLIEKRQLQDWGELAVTEESTPENDTGAGSRTIEE